MKYPILQINLNKVYENVKYMVEFCKKENIEVAGVVKGFNALPDVANMFIKGGCKYIADSRINHIKLLIDSGVNSSFILVRIPMISEIGDIVKYVDISLNSEIDTLNKIEEECIKQNKDHKVILMFDLGDLREGIVDEEELINTALHIEYNLNKVKLEGIGTNLGCYGAVVPTEENLGRLVKVSKKIEKKIGRSLNIISGGATTSLNLLMQNKMPRGINNLRIGEGILLGRDLEDLWGYDMSNLNKDTFILKAEVIEIKDKPSHPIGEIFVDAFGKKPVFEDNGIRKRAILGIGKADFVFCDQLIPTLKGINILGGSSDHLILDVHDCEEKIKVGDIIEFEMYYGPMLYLTNSPSVEKVFI